MPTTGRKGPGVPGRLRPQIFLTFGSTRVVGHQPHAPAAFTPRGNPWYSFLEAESTPELMVLLVATEKIPSVTPPGINPEAVWPVAQCLNHYATPGPLFIWHTYECFRDYFILRMKSEWKKFYKILIVKLTCVTQLQFIVKRKIIHSFRSHASLFLSIMFIQKKKAKCRMFLKESDQYLGISLIDGL
jgi:hypothetical protein